MTKTEATRFWVDGRNGNFLRADLAKKLLSDLSFAHNWLCHSDGSECEDGCAATACPDRAMLYAAIPCE